MPEKRNTASPDLLADRIRAAGLRLTPQRLAVFQALADSENHPTAAELYKQLQTALPSLSQATVYNTLQVLVEKGLVHELGDAGDGAIHYDADLTPHLNLICTNCHRIEDFDTVAIEEVQEDVAARSGYEVQGARLVYYGLCPRCQASP